MSLARSVTVGIVSGVALLAAIVTGWVWWDRVGAWQAHPVVLVEDGGDDLSFVLYVGCFDGESRASASENDERVLVMVEVRGGLNDNDCLGGAGVTLDAPLGDRVLIDRTTGDTIPTD